MKFLHTSDWHLGARLGEYSRLDEQRAVLEEIRGIADAEKVDFVIIAGDIFDNFNPSNEAVELLYRELKRLTDNGNRPVVVIAGNHDSPDRIEAPDPLAAECGIFFIGYPDFTRSDAVFDNGLTVRFPEQGVLLIDLPERPQVRILTTPYANENRLRKYLEAGSREDQIAGILSESWKGLADVYCDSEGVNILTAHLFMSDGKNVDADGDVLNGEGIQPDLFSPVVETQIVEPDGERSILHPGGLELIDAAYVPKQIQYTALGHLHRPQSVRKGGSPVVYSGSPLAFGLSEENQQKSVVIVEAEPEASAVGKASTVGKASAGVSVKVRRAEVKSGRRILRRTFSEIDSAVAWLNDNQDCYVELLIECENYISAGDRKRLHEVHDCITAVVPVSRLDASGAGADGVREMPDLTESIEDLFCSYFEYSKGNAPDEELIGLFREILAADGGIDEA